MQEVRLVIYQSCHPQTCELPTSWTLSLNVRPSVSLSSLRFSFLPHLLYISNLHCNVSCYSVKSWSLICLQKFHGGGVPLPSNNCRTHYQVLLSSCYPTLLVLRLPALSIFCIGLSCVTGSSHKLFNCPSRQLVGCIWVAAGPERYWPSWSLLWLPALLIFNIDTTMFPSSMAMSIRWFSSSPNRHTYWHDGQ